ncbi:hypothetical protein GINT2_002261 [Glugoides intestinalis]
MVTAEKSTNTQRKAREEQQIELRRQRTEELLNKKRESTKETRSNNTFEAIKGHLFSQNLEEIYNGAYECRTKLSIDVNPPIKDIISSGIVPRFVELLDPFFYNQFADTQLSCKCRFEAAWVLTNIASGTSEETKYVVKLGAVPLLVKMISESDEGLVDQSVWALGNISGDNEELRDTVLATNMLESIVGLVYKYSAPGGSIKILRNLIWLLSNLNRGRNPSPTLANMQLSFSVIEKAVQIPDPDVVSDSFWCLSYLADTSSEMIDAILNSHAIRKAYDLLYNFINSLTSLDHDEKLAKIGATAICPIIRMLGNIVTDTEEHTDRIIQLDFLKFLHPIFYQYKNKKQPRIKKEICWLLSNITAGTPQQTICVIESDLLGLLIDAISKHENFVRKEAGYAIFNILHFCTKEPQYLQRLLDHGILLALQNHIKAVENMPDAISQILDCVRYALEAGNKIKQKFGANPVVQMLIDMQFVDEIEDLQDSKNNVVVQKAYNIIVMYFEGEEEHLL